LYLGRSRAIEQRQKGFASAHSPFWKKQKQERFLRQSQGKDSREPVAIRTNQTIQRARSRAKAFFKAVAWRKQQEAHSHSRKPSHPKSKIKSVKSSLRQEETDDPSVEVPNIPKTDTPLSPLDRLKSTSTSQKDQTGVQSHQKNQTGSRTEPPQAQNAIEEQVIAGW